MTTDAFVSVIPIVVSILAIFGSGVSFALYYRANKAAIDSGSLVNKATAGKINVESKSLVLETYRELIEELKDSMNDLEDKYTSIENKYEVMRIELEKVKEELSVERKAREKQNQRIREFAPQELQDILIWGE